MRYKSCEWYGDTKIFLIEFKLIYENFKFYKIKVISKMRFNTLAHNILFYFPSDISSVKGRRKGYKFL